MDYSTGLDAPLPLLRTVMADGRRCGYRQTGSGHGAPVLFLHGLGSCSGGWRAVLAGLPPGRRLIAWDAPGFAGSDPLSAGRSSGHVAAVLALVDVIGVGQVHLVGSSWGASLAIAVAAATGDRVRSLTLLAPNTCFGALPESDRAAVRAQLLDPGFVTAADKDSFLSLLIADGSHPVVAERAFALRDALSQEGFTQAVEMMLATDTLTDARALRIPTTIMVGSNDRIAPRNDHALPIAQALSGAELIDVASCGHLAKLERPEDVIDAVTHRVALADGTW